MKTWPRVCLWVSTALLACDRPAGEEPSATPVAVQAPAIAVQAPAPASVASPDAGLHDDSLGVVCERNSGEGEELQLKPEGQGNFILAYRNDGKAINTNVRCNPVTSSQAKDLIFTCTDRADLHRQVLKITTETRQYEDEVGLFHPYLAHLHEIVAADGRSLRSEGDCGAYKFTKEGTRQVQHHKLELSCTGALPGADEYAVTTDLVFALESFPVPGDQPEGKLSFTATATASVRIHSKDGKTVVTERSFAAPELAASAMMDFTREPGGEVRLAPQDGDYRAQSEPPTRHPDGGTFHQYDFIHFHGRENSFYFQPNPESPSLKVGALVAPGDLRHHVSNLECIKKLTPT